MRFPFLTAGWSDLCIVTYSVAPELVASCLPPGLEPDCRNGQAFASLVGLTFVDTRVAGIGWPGFRTFPELNLRLYVRCGQDRGVLFVREIVPSYAVAWLARTLYNEPYEASPLSVTSQHDETSIAVEYVLRCGGAVHKISAVGGKPAIVPEDGSLEHFLKEHRWGFGTDRRGRLLRYEVEHPIWAVYPVNSFKLHFDWGKVYGSRWRFLSDAEPTSTILAVGSRITVFSPLEHHGSSA